MSTPLPVIGIPACWRMLDDHPFQIVGEKYVQAVTLGAGCLPLLIPSLPRPLDPDAVLDVVDGLLITGSPSNVHPRHYAGPGPRPETLLDTQRDATTLPLIARAVARGIPVVAICRGFQELNVTLGGSLHQHLQEIPGRADHRAMQTGTPDEKYGPAHEVALVPGGRLAAITGRSEITVNSLHGQGIDRLSDRLAVEASAADGTVEAVSAPGAKGFVLGLQWHPEWRVTENPVSMKIFTAFGDAARAYARARAGRSMALPA